MEIRGGPATLKGYVRPGVGPVMDKHGRVDQLLDLLGTEKSLLAHLEAHRAKLESHHASRERDRAILQATKAIRRAEKGVRRLDRALRNENKQHSA